MARAVVEATTHFEDAAAVARVSKGLGVPMRGIELAATGNGNGNGQRLAMRGW
jgi:pyridoxal 5'-phosphate synthase pdxS subunit